MRHIQKRYLYSAVFSSLFFIVIYGFIHVNILISILLTMLIYIGGIFLFKKDDMREFDSESVSNYYYLASKVLNQANLTSDGDIIKKVEEISKLTDDILVSLSQRPRKVESVFLFFDYYLDIAYKILYKYNFLKDRDNNSKEDEKFLKDTDKHIGQILSAFVKQNKNMQEAKVLDIETEIKMFENLSGISDSDVKVGDEGE